jgi:hypothetical protein
MATIEVTTFHLADGTGEAAFLNSDRAVQAELGPREGFVRRTTARAEDGAWLVITLWRTPGDADRSGQSPFEKPTAQSFAELVDASSLETRRYRSLD